MYVKLAFLLDITGSMEPWLNAAKNQIETIVRDTHTRYPDAEIAVAFVGYRDYGDEEQIVIIPFTDENDVVNQIRGIRARGGIDDAEDVAGGLLAIRELFWTDADVRVVVHIADAPAHGMLYARGVSDRFPNGDPGNNPDPANSMLALSVFNVNYTFIKISEDTDTMIDAFHNAYSYAGTFRVIDLRPEEIDDGDSTVRLTSAVNQVLNDSIERHIFTETD